MTSCARVVEKCYQRVFSCLLGVQQMTSTGKAKSLQQLFTLLMNSKVIKQHLWALKYGEGGCKRALEVCFYLESTCCGQQSQ
jgi:hypothetical protein